MNSGALRKPPYRNGQRARLHLGPIGLVTAMGLALSGPALAATFTTIADGNWSSPATWSGGVAPHTDGQFPVGDTINICHDVVWNDTDNITNEGTVVITPCGGSTSASLLVPSGVNIENKGGTWNIIDAALTQYRFVGGGDTGTSQAGSFKNIGGNVFVSGSVVEVAQDWTNESGATREFVDSCLITGQNFSNSDSVDILENASVSIGWHGSGSFQYSDTDFTFSDVFIQLAGTSGNVDLVKGNIDGDINYITTWNHVSNTLGSGGIFFKTDLNPDPSLTLDTYCAANFTDEGVLANTPTAESTASCPSTATFFPCQVGGDLVVIKNTNGGDGSFNYASTSVGPFTINTTAGIGVESFGVAADSTHDLTETLPIGWALDSIACEDQDGFSRGTVSLGTQSVTDIDVFAGETVTCTFTNTFDPGDYDYTIDKQVTDVDGGGALGTINAAGDIVSYNILVANTGDLPITGVVVSDALLEGAFGTLLRAADSPGNDDNTLDVGETWVFTGTYTVQQSDIDDNCGGDGTLDNTAAVISNELGQLTDSESVSCQQSPAYTIVKTVTDVGGDGADGQVNGAGDVVTYSIVVTNTGNQTITGAALSDPLLEGAQGTLGAAVESMNADGNLEVGETWTYSGTWTATQSDIDDNCGGDGQVDNTATVDSNELGPQNDGATAQCDQNPAYTILKTADDVDGGALLVDASGDVINYTIVVTNSGNQTITGVTFSDPLLEGANGTLGAPVESITADGNLEVGETWTYSGSYTVQQADIDDSCGGDGQISNTATVDSNELGPINDSANVPCSGESSYAIVKSVTDVGGDGAAGSVNAAGDIVTYSIVVTNTGNTTITGAVVTDPLLEGANGTLVGPTESITADGDLEVGEAWTYSGTYTAQQSDIDDNCGGDGTLDNTATVNSTELGPQEDSASAACVQSPNYTIVKTVTDVDGGGPPGQVDAAGDVISYSIIVSNTGNQTITGAAVTDPLLEGANGTLIGPTESISSNGDLDVAETWTYSGTYTAQQSDLDDNCGGDGQISNTATVDSNELSAQNDVANAQCGPNPAIMVIKSGVFTDNAIADGTAQPGELIAYTFTVTNTGNVTLTNIMLDDLVPGVMVLGGPIPSLDPGESDNSTFTASYAVTAEDIDGGSFANLATACGTYFGGEVCDDDPEDVPLPTPPVGVPVNSAWVLLLMIFSIMAMGWYCPPTGRRQR